MTQCFHSWLRASQEVPAWSLPRYGLLSDSQIYQPGFLRSENTAGTLRPWLPFTQVRCTSSIGRKALSRYNWGNKDKQSKQRRSIPLVRPVAYYRSKKKKPGEALLSRKNSSVTLGQLKPPPSTKHFLSGLREEHYEQRVRHEIKHRIPLRPRWISLRGWSQLSEPANSKTLSHLPGDVSNNEPSWFKEMLPPLPSEEQMGKDSGIDQAQETNENAAAKSDEGDGLDRLKFDWSRRFTKLFNGEGVDLFIIKNDLLASALEDVVIGRNNLKAIHQAWLRMGPSSENTKQQIWEDMMLWCMQNTPKNALRLLIGTMKGSNLMISRYVIADCLEYLSRHFLDTDGPVDPWALWAIYHLTCKYILKGSQDHHSSLVLSDYTVYLIMKQGDARAFLDVLLDSRVSLHANTMLHFLDESVKWGTVSTSLRILQAVVNSRYDVSKPQLQAACISLLRTRFDEKVQYKMQVAILSQILEMGIRPEIALYNVMLHNAIEAEQFDTAWKMYDMATANNLKPDAITYAVMLKAARLSNDPSLVRRALDQAEKDVRAMEESQRLLGDVLNVISHRNATFGRSAFPYMLDIYLQYCDPTPLKDLGMCPPEVETPPGRLLHVRAPTPYILGQMICAYLMMHRDSVDLHKTYVKYHDLILARHPLLLPTAQWDYVANSFILALSRKSENMAYCAIVVRHMLEAAGENKSATAVAESKTSAVAPTASQDLLSHDPRSDVVAERSFPRRRPSSSTIPHIYETIKERSYRPCVPTVRTWSLLAGAYFRHKQKSSAERVLRMMRDRGLRPDATSWDAIIGGYASLQDVDGALDAVQRMQADNHEISLGTLNSLSKIWDTQRLLKALEKVTKEAAEKKDQEKADADGIVGSGSLKDVASSMTQDKVESVLREETEQLLGTEPSQVGIASAVPGAA